MDQERCVRLDGVGVGWTWDDVNAWPSLGLGVGCCALSAPGSSDCGRCEIKESRRTLLGSETRCTRFSGFAFNAVWKAADFGGVLRDGRSCDRLREYSRFERTLKRAKPQLMTVTCRSPTILELHSPFNFEIQFCIHEHFLK